MICMPARPSVTLLLLYRALKAKQLRTPHWRET